MFQCGRSIATGGGVLTMEPTPSGTDPDETRNTPLVDGQHVLHRSPRLWNADAVQVGNDALEEPLFGRLIDRSTTADRKSCSSTEQHSAIRVVFFWRYGSFFFEGTGVESNAAVELFWLTGRPIRGVRAFNDVTTVELWYE